MFLSQEKQNKGIKWAIKDVFADYLIINDQYESDNYLSPTSHEINFTSLQKYLTKDNNLANITYSGFNYDQLSTFLFLIDNGKIEFLHVKSQKYHILNFLLPTS